jgi:hypothetical protein
LRVVPADSLFFTPLHVDPFMRLLEQPRVRIAFPGFCGFLDFIELLQYHLRSGRRCFAMFPNNWWNRLRAGPLGPPADFSVTPVLVFRDSFLGEISREKRIHGTAFPE